MTGLLDAALEYAARVRPVFPVEPRGKRPLGRLVQHGMKDASTDQVQIEKWWKAEPEANVGVATGVAFDVVDVDGPEGMANLAIECGNRESVDGPTVTSRDDQHAHCYIAVTGHGNRAGFIPGCDLRGRGGYVLAPPSVHPTGAVYAWREGNADPDFGPDAPIRPAPRWLLELLQRRPEPRLIAAPATEITPARATGYGRRALEGEVGKVLLAPVGSRNDTLNKAAFSLGQLIGGGVIDVDTVADALLVAAERVGLEMDEARRTIASGLRSGAAQPRRVA